MNTASRLEGGDGGTRTARSNRSKNTKQKKRAREWTAVTPILALCDALRGLGCRWAIEAVEYEVQRGGNKMLKVEDDEALP